MKVGLAQVNNSFGTACYLPNSVGCLVAYALEQLPKPEMFEFMLDKIIYKRMPVEEAANQLEDADVVFASLYVWNKNMTFAILQRLKEINPKIITVIGGPQIEAPLPTDPKRAERFMDAHPYVDIACHLEGEKAFVEILKNISGDWGVIPSISYRAEGGEVKTNPLAPRLLPNFHDMVFKEDVLMLPSPYLTGIFDLLMKANPNQEWLVLYETNRGCPFRCNFCDWGGLVASKVFKFYRERNYKELEWTAQHKIEFMFCADANFAIFDRDVEIAQYAADVKAKYGYPKALSVQNAKNAAERVFKAQYTLAKAGLNKGVTLAFQSRDEHVLETVERENISLEDFRRLQKRFTKEKIETYSDMIIGLAEETYDSFANGVSETISDGQHNRIQFSNLSNQPGAGMSDPEYIKKHGIITKKVRVVTYHGSIYEPEWEIAEYEELVIATNTMPLQDWVRARAFSWMTALLHFDKILQLSLIMAKETCNVTYRELIEIFSECSNEKFPVICEIKNFFLEKARSIQRGEVENCTGPDRLNIWWPADEFVFIDLVRDGKIGKFYNEAEAALLEFLKGKHPEIKSILRDATLLNRRLIKLPFLNSDTRVVLSHNILEFVESVKVLEKIELRNLSSIYRIKRTSETWSNWDEWMQKVVWWGNKKGAYLYGNVKTDIEYGGHY